MSSDNMRDDERSRLMQTESPLQRSGLQHFLTASEDDTTKVAQLVVGRDEEDLKKFEKKFSTARDKRIKSSARNKGTGC